MQVFLATQPEMNNSEFEPQLAAVLETGLVSALLIRRGNLSQEDYEQRIKLLRPIAQSCDCAVLLENSPALVKKTGADGVHMSTGQQKFAEAIASLKPQFIVGAGDITSRHEAMLRGEAGADYILFGDLDHAPDAAAIDLASWWAELFETPGVLFQPVLPPRELKSASGEFIGLGNNLWASTDNPAEAIKSVFDAEKVR